MFLRPVISLVMSLVIMHFFNFYIKYLLNRGIQKKLKTKCHSFNLTSYSYCNDRLWWKKVRTKARRGKCSSFLNKVMNTEQNNKREVIKPKQSRVAPTLTQKINTHNSKVKLGSPSMILNQGQRLTAASD